MSLPQVLHGQAGVVSRRQLLALGLVDTDIRRMVRRKDLARLHPGVFLEHNGQPTWPQRAWAACLYYEPAALGPVATLVTNGLLTSTTSTLVDVVLSPHRRVGPVPGIEVGRSIAFDKELHPLRRPPQLRLESAVLRVASNARDDAAAVAILADACRSRRTTAERLGDSLAGLPRLPRRAFLAAVLEDVAHGVQSVLEHRYLRDVERAHGLPRGVRQGRVLHGREVAYRDVEYLKRLLVIELDGSFHDPAEARWDDLERDVASALRGARTVRLGWRQVLDPCRTAQSVGRLLGALGWEGHTQRCPRCP
jgi:hypothetical protein